MWARFVASAFTGEPHRMDESGAQKKRYNLYRSSLCVSYKPITQLISVFIHTIARVFHSDTDWHLFSLSMIAFASHANRFSKGLLTVVGRAEKKCMNRKRAKEMCQWLSEALMAGDWIKIRKRLLPPKTQWILSDRHTSNGAVHCASKIEMRNAFRASTSTFLIKLHLCNKSRNIEALSAMTANNSIDFSWLPLSRCRR